jgi:hypothetical protein
MTGGWRILRSRQKKKGRSWFAAALLLAMESGQF